MASTLILHDLPPSDADDFLPRAGFTIFAASPAVHCCVGCFGCWLKTPGRCVIRDRGSDFMTLFTSHDEVIFLSRMVFGGLSPDIKAVLDRSISFLLPFFRIVNGEMHHTLRFEKMPDLKYVFYGDDITDDEMATAKKLAGANAVNLGTKNYSVQFYRTARECAEVLQ
jgi:multimeric flavodoxin WrbA